MTIREPVMKPVSIADLRPTQMTVGLREVAEKRTRWRELEGDKEPEYLGSHMIPTVLGPKGRHYVVDHHHLARALHEEKVPHILTNVIADLSAVDRDSFWVVMDCKGWCHPYDAEGVRRAFDDIPSRISDMQDDPYRSLAGELRRAGGFAKDTTPFSEFIWADFLRRRIKQKAIAADFESALAKAVTLAKSAEANYLPGWCGPIRN